MSADKAVVLRDVMSAGNKCVPSPSTPFAFTTTNVALFFNHSCDDRSVVMGRENAESGRYSTVGTYKSTANNMIHGKLNWYWNGVVNL